LQNLHIQLDKAPDLEAVIKFVREVLNIAFPGHSDISVEDDLYVRGFDSLQTAEAIALLKNGIQAGDPTHNTSFVNIPFIYKHPSISTLASAILAHLDGTSQTNGFKTQQTATKRMEDLVAKYTQDLPVADDLGTAGTLDDLSSLPQHHVILTGATGSLGTQILVALLKDPNVAHVTCLDRSSNARERIAASFKTWKSKPVLDPARVSFYQADYGRPDFGLRADVLKHLKDTVTAVVHNAWKVDFNHSLESFAAVQIKGVRNLIDFCATARARPRLFFVSSVSSVTAKEYWTKHADGRMANGTKTNGSSNGGSTSTVAIPETLPPTMDAARPMGYGQSKLVSEFILSAAVNAPRGIDACVLRVGQIAGPADPENGAIWNAHEWVPAMLKTSKALGKIPGDGVGMVDWVPVDLLAAAITEMVVDSDKNIVGGFQVVHLINPAAKPWDDLLPVVRKRLGGDDKIDVVSMKEWVEELERVGSEEGAKRKMEEMPALKIVEFFRDLIREDDAEGTRVVLGTEEARRVSSVMRGLSELKGDWMQRWMEDWGL
jgi:thioester reductase-like protein